jgi:2-methylcitrate dehydratase PrpD
LSGLQRIKVFCFFFSKKMRLLSLMSNPGGITARLAAFASDLTFDQLPPALVLHLKLALLDTFAAAFAASGLSDACGGVLAYAAGQTGQPSARVWTTGERLFAPAAAFANGVLARALDCDDIIENPQIHVSVAVVPSVLAITDGLPTPVSGRDLLTALAVGSEVQCRLAAAMAARQDHARFPMMLATQIFGYVSGTVASGRLLGLAPPALRSAIGLASMQAAGTEEMVVHAANSQGKNIYAGFSNQGAVQSALLARHGVLADGAALEGQAGLFAALFGGRYDPEILTADLGARFLATRTCFKYWPGTLVSHAFIEAALLIRSREQIGPGEIAEVRATVGVWGRAMSEPLAMRRAPPSASAAMNSLPFILGTALQNRTVSLTDFFEPARNDPAVLAMAARVTTVFDAAMINPNGLEPALLTITTTDGRVASAASPAMPQHRFPPPTSRRSSQRWAPWTPRPTCAALPLCSPTGTRCRRNWSHD